MNARLQRLALEKQGLIERCALSRTQVCRDARHLRDSLPWTRASAAPPMGRLALGIAFSAIGVERVARVVIVASRFLLYVRLVRSVLGWARGA
jgi:hypothetical protein